MKDIEEIKVQKSLENDLRVLDLSLFKMNKKRYFALAPGAMQRVMKIVSLESPDDDVLIPVSDDTTSEVLTTFEMNNKHYIATSGKKQVDIWDIEKKAIEYSLEGHEHKIRSLIVYENNGKLFLITGSFDFSIKVWDLSARSCVATLEGHSHWVWSLALYEKDNVTFLASGDYGKTIKLWDLTSYTCTSTLEGHSKAVMSLTTFYKDGKPFLGSGSFGEIKVWDLSSNQLVKTLNRKRWCYALTTLEIDGELHLLSGGDDGHIKVFNTDNFKLERTLLNPIPTDDELPDSFIENIDVRVLDTFFDEEKNLSYLVSGYWDGSIILWNDEEAPAEDPLAHKFPVEEKPEDGTINWEKQRSFGFTGQ